MADEEQTAIESAKSVDDKPNLRRSSRNQKCTDEINSKVSTSDTKIDVKKNDNEMTDSNDKNDIPDSKKDAAEHVKDSGCKKQENESIVFPSVQHDENNVIDKNKVDKNGTADNKKLDENDIVKKDEANNTKPVKKDSGDVMSDANMITIDEDGPFEVIEETGQDDDDVYTTIDDVDFESNEENKAKNAETDASKKRKISESNEVECVDSSTKDSKHKRGKMNTETNNASDATKVDKPTELDHDKLDSKQKVEEPKDDRNSREKEKSTDKPKSKENEVDHADLKEKSKDKQKPEKDTKQEKSNDKERGRSKDKERSKSRDKEHNKSKEESQIKEKLDQQKKDRHLAMLEQYWKAVKDNPADFTGWTYLLQYVDQENDVKSAKTVYNDFLSRYPYCYGYWRKYADFLKRNNLKDHCEAAFEQGVKAIPLSIDLWTHYITYLKQSNVTEDRLRNIYKRAIQSCGKEFRSDRLWESYLKWELELNNFKNATAIFDQWLATPTQGHNGVYDKFKEYVRSHSPQKILSVDEFFFLREEILKDIKKNDKFVGYTISDDAPPGEEAPDNLDKLNEEETKALREKIILCRNEIHKPTTKEVMSRWCFEEGIKRPYFHVKPLETCQLKNWKSYLEFEIKEGNKERIILLFERCLIACAFYEEFWIQYVQYLQTQEELVDLLRDTFVRACTIHHTNKVNIHLLWAFFEEEKGNSNKAIEILEKIDKATPGHLNVMLHRINIERRMKNLDKVVSLYDQYIGDASLNSDVVMCLLSKYIRFCTKIMKDVPKAISVLRNAIEKYKLEIILYTKLIDVYYENPKLYINEIVATMDEVLDLPDISPNVKILFLQRKLQFLEAFSEDCYRIQDAFRIYNEYAENNVIVPIRETKKAKQPNEKETLPEPSVKTNASEKSAENSNFPFLGLPPPPPPDGPPSHAPVVQQPHPQYQQNYYAGVNAVYSYQQPGYQAVGPTGYPTQPQGPYAQAPYQSGMYQAPAGTSDPTYQYANYPYNYNWQAPYGPAYNANIPGGPPNYQNYPPYQP